MPMTVKDMNGGGCAQLPPFSITGGNHHPGGCRQRLHRLSTLHAKAALRLSHSTSTKIGL